MNHLFVKWLTAMSICLGTGVSLTDIHYSIKENGVMVSLDYNGPINDDDIIVWKSDRRWIYLSLFDVRAPKNKFTQQNLKWPVKKILMDEFNESIQLAILIGKPIMGYDILNSKTSSGTVLFIHTKMKNSEVANLKRHINKNGTPVYDVIHSSDFSQDTTNFQIAFDKTRLELGPNSIFKYEGKLYTTNHPDEESSMIYPGLMSTELVAGTESVPERIYANSPTGEIINEKMSATDFVAQNKYVQDDTHLYTYIDKSELSYESPANEEKWFKKLFQKIKKIKNGTPYLDNDKSKGLFLIQRNQPRYYSYAYEKPLPIIPDWIEINDVETGIFPATYQDLYDPLIVTEELLDEPEPVAVSSDWIDIKRHEISFNGEYPNLDKYYPGPVSISKYFPNGIPNDTLAQQNWDKLESRSVSMISAGIIITANLDGVAIYIDGILVGETPLREPIDITPGWHQVSGLTFMHSKAFIESYMEYVNEKPVLQNIQLLESQAVYVDSRNLSAVNFSFNNFGDSPKNRFPPQGGILIRLPLIISLCGIITWGMI